MPTITNLNEIGSVAQPNGLDAFHAIRLQFNTAFLNEDFVTAYQLCKKAMQEPELAENQNEELLRFLLMLGKTEDALLCLDSIIIRSPDNYRYSLKKAEILRIINNQEDYLSLIQTLLKDYPKQQEVYIEYAAYLNSQNLLEEQENLRLLAQENSISLPMENLSYSLPQQEHLAPTSPDTHLLSFLQLFAGRENAYARQWVADDGKHGYTLVNEPLNINTLRNHLNGNYTLGVYQLDSSAKVKWIVFDLDVDKAHQDDLADIEFKEWIDNAMQKCLQQIIELLSAYKISANIEFSGFKGYHLWILLEEKISAVFARSFAQRIAAQVPIGGLPIHIEIFPKQTRISSSSFGNLVKLPYGIHRRSGLISTMLSEDLSPIPFEKFILSPRITDTQTFISAIQSLDPTFGIHSATQAERENKQNQVILPVTPESSVSDPENDPEWLCLKQYCHAISFIDSLIHTRGVISPQQKNVLRYTCGYLKNGPSIVNHLLKKCHEAAPEDLMKSGFKGNAISCNKIRAYMAGDVDPAVCNCSFDPDSGTYQSPLLHLKKLDRSINPSLQLNELKLKELVNSYLKLRKEHQELSSLLFRTEQEILRAFVEIGVNEFCTPYGRLIKTESDEKVHLTLELI
ncbi:MAG: CRISPR-associated primase-polymerase type A1 [Candidatus Cloacimonas sp.]|jgi:hypothetical protein|nr:CRISPR-associated primase-polymerase type A1 [Candidatus Cloacimonas sp.]